LKTDDRIKRTAWCLLDYLDWKSSCRHCCWLVAI